VRQFSEQDLRDAIELRGTLEGLAARMAAERGVDEALLVQARRHLDAIDAALDVATLGEPGFAAYVRHNGGFHALLGRMSGSELLQRELVRAACCRLRRRAVSWGCRSASRQGWRCCVSRRTSTARCSTRSSSVKVAAPRP